MSRERGAPTPPQRSADAGRRDSQPDSDLVEAIARRVADLLAQCLGELGSAAPRRLLSAAEVAEWWGIDRSWVYGHADELGAIRLGAGRRPRLRFDPDLVAERLGGQAASRPAPGIRRRRARRSRRMPGDTAQLLPLKGEPELRSSTRNRDRPGGGRTPPAAAPKAKASAR